MGVGQQEAEGPPPPKLNMRETTRGAAFARSRLNSANFVRQLDIRVQFSDTDMMELRQCLHT